MGLNAEEVDEKENKSKFRFYSKVEETSNLKFEDFVAIETRH